MKKLARLSGLLLLLASSAMAQDAPAQPKTNTRYTPKVDLSAGFTYRPYYSSSGATLPMHGWYASGDYNVRSWIGAEVEMLGVYKNAGAGTKVDIYTLMVGPRLYPLGHRTLTPLAHFLYGGGRYTLSVPSIGGFPSSTTTSTSQAWEMGGGVDTNVWRHLGIRLQADYGKTSFFSGNANKGSARISVGIVYHFGSR